MDARAKVSLLVLWSLAAACSPAPVPTPVVARPQSIPKPQASAASPPENNPSLTRPDGRAPRQVLIPGGRVMLGEADRGPQRPVDVSPFLLDVTEVTAGQFEGCIRAGACKDEITLTNPYPHAGDNGDMAFRRPGCTLHVAGQHDHPITCVTWTQAQAFCAWAGGRLPSLAEWMLAAVGTEGRTYPWGNTEYDGSQANLAGAELREFTDRHHTTVYYATKRRRDGALRSAPVGSFPKGVSPEGVYDLYGNVFEWLVDTECAMPPCAGTERATRGSGWTHGFVRSLQGATSQPENYGYEALGFRCAASVGG